MPSIFELYGYKVYFWSNENTFDILVELMMYTQNIDLRIEPHSIKVEDFENGNPFVKEILDTGLKVA